MSGFSFSSSNPAPAPPGGFSFGGNTTPPSSNTAAPSGFGSSTAQAPAPPSAFSFGGNPAPAPGAPAPASGFSFGAAAPSTFGATPAPGVFGAAPTPSSGGFGFGAPAPGAGGGLFGQPAPAPAFGATPAPAFGGFGGTNNAATPAATSNSVLNLNGKTPYSALPPEYQKAIDTIHEAMMKHKRSMNQVQAMGPQSLIPSNGEEAISPKVKKLQQRLNVFQKEVASVQVAAEQYRDRDRNTLEQSYVYAKWPTEAMAARKGVRLTSNEEKKENNHDLQAQLRDMLERQVPYVDRIERMPSPYLWQVLDQMSLRLKSLTEEVMMIQQQLESSRSIDGDVVDLLKIVENQEQIIYVLRRDINKMHYDMQKLRKIYTAFETGENVLDKAQLEEWERQKLIDEQIQMQKLRSAPDSKTNPPGNPSFAGQPSAPAPTSFGFGASPAPGAPAPTSFGFGAKPAPAAGAPAPSGGFSFGGAGAPATGAPATGGFSFGGAPSAPAAPTFGASAPAPALGAAAPTAGFAKPATSTPSKNKKSGGGSRNKSRR